MSTGKVVMGILAGFATGALIGVLFAPEKGSVTRKKIAKKGEDYADAVKEKFEESIDSITEKFHKVNEDVSGYAEQAKAKFEKSGKKA